VGGRAGDVSERAVRAENAAVGKATQGKLAAVFDRPRVDKAADL